MEPSVFRESPLSPSDVANYLRDELKRLRKRRQIVTPASPGSPEPMVEGQQGGILFIKNNYDNNNYNIN